MEILIDTREQQYFHISKILWQKNIKYIRKKLDFGDYSFRLEGKTFEKAFVIERKNSIDELCLSFTKERERFKREFERAKENDCCIVLLIEDDFKKIKLHQYRSKMHPNALSGSIKSWREKGLIDNVYFGNKSNSADFMLKLMKEYYHCYLGAVKV